MYRSISVLVLSAVLVLPAFGDEVTRPSFDLRTDAAYDIESVPAYTRSHDRIYEHIDDNLEAHTGNLQRWVRQRSISAQNDGISEMASMLAEDLRRIGFGEVEIVPTTGHPGVWGFYDAGADKTLVVYLMYDVQPVDPEDWQVDPFGGEIVDHEMGKVLMARAATNQKGPERAFLNALESIVAVDGTLPVNLMIAAEGEEELGSPHYPEFIAKFEERLRTADGVLFPFNAQDASGDVSMFLGVKGILYVELEATGHAGGGPMNAEIHGSLKAIVDSPVWRLVQALASMTSEDGNTILIDGYYDSVRGPTESETLLINAMLEDYETSEAMMKKALGVERWIDGISGREALLEYLYTPTLNIDGIWGGYTGEGVKTILPHRATAKVDSRLVPDQTSEEALALIRKHLDDHGFEDIVVREMSGYPPAQTAVEADVVQTAIGVYRKYGHTPSVAPRIGGSAPYYVFTDVLGLPLVSGGLGFGTGAHAPNELMVIEPKEGSGIAGLAEIEKFYVDLLFAMSE